jgi:uncharacterized protein (TIGR02996 family)
MTQDEEQQAFFAQIEADPADKTTKLVFADWLYEHGDVDLGYAFQWAASRDLNPEWLKTINYHGKGGWTWHVDEMPMSVYICLNGAYYEGDYAYKISEFLVYKDFAACWQDLSVALKEARESLQRKDVSQ